MSISVRPAPLPVAAAIIAASIANTVVAVAVGRDNAAHFALVGLGIALFTVVSYVGRRAGAAVLLALIADAALSTWLLDQPLWDSVGITALFYALCWITAEFVGARRAYDEEVAARLAVADLDRERSAADAVYAERTRIARELHDVVAHAVSVMIIQADGAGYALRRNPDAAEQALANISSTGRQALGELRRTVALLRTDRMPAELPQYGTAGIAKLVDMMRKAGLTVELELTGELDQVGPEVSLGIHRIVQESLTNALRHAGPDAIARVRVERRDADVVVEIVDSGGGTGGRFRQGTGNGLVGMRERVAVLHGSLAAGPYDGGWRVRAELPVRDDAAAYGE